MRAVLRHTERLEPQRQLHWDWRAAANFICGGAGGGLLLWSPFVSLQGLDARGFLLAGLALVVCGLTCVWLEIGRPWRALNVFRHVASSWMTREASVAPLLFASGAFALWRTGPVSTSIAGLLGAAFLYSQARILGADKGIPAWRHPLCAPLVVATGLTEGAALLAMASALVPALLASAWLLAALAAVRAFAWRRYLAALARDGAPAGSLAAFEALDNGFVWAGNALPALLAVIAALAGLPLLAVLAGLLALAAGIHLKYTLVCRAAYTQGFALPKLPVRGRGQAAPGIKPGWRRFA